MLVAALEFYNNFKFLIAPFIVWCGIQLFKVIYDRCETKKWHWKRFFGAGGMPSAHSATIMTLTTMIGKYYGINSAFFALSCIFTFIVMYDAMGVRREVGNQARVLNTILKDRNMTNAEKLQEMTGHTPVQVLMGAFIGFIAGIIA